MSHYEDWDDDSLVRALGAYQRKLADHQQHVCKTAVEIAAIETELNSRLTESERKEAEGDPRQRFR